MKLKKYDWLFVGLVVVIVGVFVAISGKEKTKTVPHDDAHRVAYDAAYRNAPRPDASLFKRTFFKPDKKAAEVYCEPCHKEKKIPFPPNHPPKNRCLFCHKLAKI